MAYMVPVVRTLQHVGRTKHDKPMTQAPPPEAHHEHPEHLAHHFESLQQQYDSGKLGIWLFLTTEILMFSGLFCGYAVLRALHPEIFLYAHHYLSVPLGALNTAVLIFSSFTMAWGVRGRARPEQAPGPPARDHAGLRVRLPGREVRRVQGKMGRSLAARQVLHAKRAAEGMDMPSFEAEKDKTAGKAAEKSGIAAAAKPSAAAVPAGAVGERSTIAPAAIGPTGLSPLGSIAINSAAIAMSCGTARSRTTCSSSSASTSP